MQVISLAPALSFPSNSAGERRIMYFCAWIIGRSWWHSYLAMDEAIDPVHTPACIFGIENHFKDNLDAG